MSHFIIAQLVGFVAAAISVIVFQIDSRSKILFLSIFSALLYALSFYLLRAYTGAALNLLGSIRCFTYYKVKPSRRTLWVYWLFLGLAVALGLLTWAGPVSLLAIGGTAMYSTGQWQKKTKNIRRTSLLASPFWFSYNFISKSYPGMLVEVLIFCSNLIGQYRFDFRKLRLKKVSSRAS